ncbi:TetR/AcrR family transcriptional regulator [Moraxella sp. ZJ142]|uniref:TetR/AcrR family transcriptional regulator n=1 Tax=Moraxella marmotae TaxID=3344520 RepID=UPI0035D3DF11
MTTTDLFTSNQPSSASHNPLGNLLKNSPENLSNNPMDNLLDNHPNDGKDGTKKRKNNPELLKHSLIMAAKDLMVKEGVANLSMQKVADLAGTSKGGLFHHFKNKDELLGAVIGLFIAQLNTAILAKVDELGDIDGKFTKAYVQVMFENPEIGLDSGWTGLIRAINADAIMQQQWHAWTAQKQRQFADTDSAPRYAVIRYAVLGASFDAHLESDADKKADIYQTLLELLP